MSRKYKIQKDLFRTQSYLYKKLALFKVSYTSAFQLISEIQTHARPGQSMLAKSHSWFKDLTPPSINHLARNCTGPMGQARSKGFWGQGTDAHCPTQLDRLRLATHPTTFRPATHPTTFRPATHPTFLFALKSLCQFWWHGFGEGGVYLSRGGGGAHWADCRVKGSWLRALLGTGSRV